MPLDEKIHTEVTSMDNKAGNDFTESIVSEIVSTGKTTGYRPSDYSQKSQQKAGYHHYPSGNVATKALHGNGVIFADSKGVLS